MSIATCEDCGERVYGGFCVNCHEEHFIAAQYLSEGEGVPPLIAEAADEQKLAAELRKGNEL